MALALTLAAAAEDPAASAAAPQEAVNEAASAYSAIGTISRAQVAQHQIRASMWVVVDNLWVVNVTSFIPRKFMNTSNPLPLRLLAICGSIKLRHAYTSLFFFLTYCLWLQTTRARTQSSRRR